MCAVTTKRRILALIYAPFAGLAFVVFLPVVGFALILRVAYLSMRESLR
jgi:hypothetical protein